MYLSMVSVSSIAVALMLNLCVGCSFVLASSQEGKIELDSVWQKIEDENGVLVYSHEIDGSDLIKVKTEVIIDANMEKIKSILDDVSHRKDWVPYLVESRVLKKYSEDEKLEYSFFVAPWPASDRDFVYCRRLLHKDNTKIIFTMTSKQSELMPKQDGVVRADLIESQYTLTALSSKQTKVELIFHADPKGWLPNWIVNIIQQALPFMMLQNLKVAAE